MDNVDRVEAELARQIRPLVDRDLTIVFYDLTTVRIHGEGEVDDDIRRACCSGRSPKSSDCRQMPSAQ